MNVQAIMIEPTELPASGAAHDEAQKADGGEFEEILAQASPEEDQIPPEDEEATADQGESDSAALAGAQGILATQAPVGRVLPLIESLALGLQRAISGGLRTPDMSPPQPVPPNSEQEQQARALPLIESLSRGLRQQLQVSVQLSATEAASQASDVPIESSPQAETMAGHAELPAPDVSRDVAVELPVVQRPAVESSDGDLSETARSASTPIMSAAGGGTTAGSDGGSQDAPQSDAPVTREAGTPPPTASGNEFAAALEARESARSAPAPAQSVATLPVQLETILSAPPTGSTSAPTPFPVAGAPEEVLPVHVEWLAARQGGNARISLHPPELGELELMVKVRGSAVDIVIRAQEPAAQMAAVQSRDLLAEALSGRDLQIDQFDVRGLQTNLGSDDSPAQTQAQAQQEGSAKTNGEDRKGMDDSAGNEDLATDEGEDPDMTLPMPSPIESTQPAVDLLA